MFVSDILPGIFVGVATARVNIYCLHKTFKKYVYETKKYIIFGNCRQGFCDALDRSLDGQLYFGFFSFFIFLFFFYAMEFGKSGI